MSYVIYKICCDDFPEYVYVGSTLNFTRRKSQHKGCCNNENDRRNNYKLYQTIIENGGWDAWRVVVIEELGEVTKLQAHIREEEIRVELGGNLNIIRAYISEEQNKATIKARYLKYYKENKTEIGLKKKIYRKENIEKIKEYNLKYKEENKTELNLKKREYHEKHKDKIIQYQREYRVKKKLLIIQDVSA